MTEVLRLAVAFSLAAAMVMLTVPLAIAVARRTDFLDAPKDYKAHGRATPYLGGAAVLSAALAVAAMLGDDAVSRYWPLFVGTIALSAVGTIDDRVSLSPLLRVALEALAAGLLWSQGLGWSFLGSEAGNLLLTAFWIVGVINAFNLMDNLDGAAAAVATASTGCVAALALIGDDVALAAVAVALCGALIAFLRFNLARPSRIFLGDGGSMAIGFLVAAGLIAAPGGHVPGWAAFLAASLIVAVPAFDTTLVVISRRRRGAPVFSGATDHTTHRLLAVLKSPRVVAVVLAATQLCLGALAIEASRIGEATVVAVFCAALAAAAAGIAAAEYPQWTPLSEDP